MIEFLVLLCLGFAFGYWWSITENKNKKPIDIICGFMRKIYKKIINKKDGEK